MILTIETREQEGVLTPYPTLCDWGVLLVSSLQASQLALALNPCSGSLSWREQCVLWYEWTKRIRGKPQKHFSFLDYHNRQNERQWTAKFLVDKPTIWHGTQTGSQPSKNREWKWQGKSGNTPGSHFSSSGGLRVGNTPVFKPGQTCIMIWHQTDGLPTQNRCILDNIFL
jgi:hypothetical protein